MRFYRLSDYLRSKYPDLSTSGHVGNRNSTYSGEEEGWGEGLKLAEEEVERIKVLARVEGKNLGEVLNLLIKWLHHRKLSRN